MSDILERIVAKKKERLDEAKRNLPPGELMSILPTSTGSGRFIEPLRRDGINIIAEIKKRSPSKGVIRESFDPVAIARNYTAGGAAAISCLTEEDFFDGSLEYLRAVRRVTHLPILRKDFIFDEYQLMEASHAGADAVLLIAAMLDGPLFSDLLRASESLGLDVLVEIHDREELDKVKNHDVSLLGINPQSADFRDDARDIARSGARPARHGHAGQRERHQNAAGYRSTERVRLPRLPDRRGVDARGG